MKNVNNVILLLSLICATNLIAQSQEWVRRYNGPANVVDGATAITIDVLGNIYVTGRSANTTSTFECTTIKYDSAGDEKWIRKYHGPVDSNYYDTGWGIAADGFGNVYVTAASRDSIALDDIATIKYDSLGNELWVARYGGSGDDYDWPFDIKTDNSGNVYITGRSVGAGTGFDYITIKYDSAGNEKWAQRYNGTGNSSDEAYSVAVDNAGNVYTTGTSTGSGTGLDFATVKYDSLGNEDWVRRYNSSGVMDEFSTRLAVDNFGNIYISGGSWKFLQGIPSDIITVKYDSAGNEKWVKRYNGPGNDDDITEAIVADASGNIYVAGSSYQASSRNDFVTIKYNTDGDTLWTRRYNGTGNQNDAPEAMTLDIRGNVYITGKSRGAVDDDYATVVYDSLGNEVTAQRYDGPNSGGAWQDASYGVVADAHGNFYVTGFSGGIGSCYDMATVKYSGMPGVESRPTRDIISLQIFPNPFRNKIDIRWQIIDDRLRMTDNNPQIKIYDVSGQLVRQWDDPTIQLSDHISWAGTDHADRKLPSGVYILKCEAGEHTKTKKLLLIR